MIVRVSVLERHRLLGGFQRAIQIAKSQLDA
jgi:hypothetical protein